MMNYVFVIVGFNSSAYGLARSLHAKYQVKPVIFGDFNETSPILCSTIVTCHRIEAFRNPNNFSRVLIRFARQQQVQGKQTVLLTSSEYNLYHIQKYYEDLSDYYIIPYPNDNEKASLMDKSHTFQLASQAHLPFPKNCFLSIENNDYYERSWISFPMVIKPARSATYRELDFAGKQKNYFVNSQDQLTSIVKKIREADYQDKLVLQEKVPSAEYNEFSVNGYIDRQGNIRALAFGRALKGWPTPQRRGNHLIIVSVTEEEQAILHQFVRQFFEVQPYFGFFNFDFIQNSDTNEMLFLEFNPRQGRSHYYSELSGVSLVEALVEDIVENKPFVETKLSYRKFVWLETTLEHLIEDLSESARQRLNDNLEENFVDLTFTYPYDLHESAEFEKYVWIKLNNVAKVVNP